MGWRLAVWVWLVVGWMGVALVLALSADADAATLLVPDTSVGSALRSLASRASDVFVGQVVSITRRGGVMEIVFHVDESVVGKQAGKYTLREWAGLWPLGQHRYVVGQRAMVFLYPAGQTGLSSAVDGAEGVVPVMVQGVGAVPLLDVRLLATRIVRGQTEPLSNLEYSAVSVEDAADVVRRWREVRWREPVRLPLPVKFRPVVPVRVPFVGDADAVR